jgi:type I restriction enzyme, S subunit
VANGSFASLRENVKTYKEENYALMVKTQDFSNDFSRGLTYTDQKGFDYLQKSRLYGGELMLSNIGASIGKAFVIPTMNIRMTLAPNAIVVKCLDVVMTEHLRYFILSYYGQKMLSDFTAGTAMPKFSKTQLHSALIPVPPYSEQKRIIEKIKQLDILACTL